jgi:carboxyl-terminal processing protease
MPAHRQPSISSDHPGTRRTHPRAPRHALVALACAMGVFGVSSWAAAARTPSAPAEATPASFAPPAEGAFATRDKVTTAVPAPDDAQRALNIETFDAVWSIVRDTHWDPTLGGVDWNAVRARLLPRAADAKSAAELRGVLEEMLAALGQSHFAIIPGDAIESDDDAPATDTPGDGPGTAPASGDQPGPGQDGAAPSTKAADAPAADKPSKPARRKSEGPGNPGAELALLEAPQGADGTRGEPEAVIVSVREGSIAATRGLRPGMVVTAIDGRSPTRSLPQGDGLQRYERAATVHARGTGMPGTATTWTVRSPDGTERTVEFVHEPDPRPRIGFGNLPPFPVELTSGLVDADFARRCGAPGAKVGRIAFSGWFIPVAQPFNKAVDALRQSDGIIIDLRGNPGGIGGMAMGIGGHFTPEQQRLGTMITRDGELNFITNPRTVSTTGEAVEVFGGPVAILVDERTASTSEIFAGGMQYLGRARIFGTRTAGAALPAFMETMPNGDVFLHAIADYRLPNGKALEADGVKPDHDRTYTRLDYEKETDPVMADAVRWIASEKARKAKDSSS